MLSFWRKLSLDTKQDIINLTRGYIGIFFITYLMMLKGLR